MKHVITSKDNPGLAGFKFNEGDLVEFTDKYGSEHVMVVIPECRCTECCMYRDGLRYRCKLDSDESLCYVGMNTRGCSAFVAFKYVDDLLEGL